MLQIKGAEPLGQRGEVRGDQQATIAYPSRRRETLIVTSCAGNHPATSERKRGSAASARRSTQNTVAKKVDETDRRTAARWRKKGSPPWCEAGTAAMVLVVLPAPRVWQPSLMSFEYLLGWGCWAFGPVWRRNARGS
jgi:23S rRNA A1618 N6-methylase RlmF